MNIMINETMNLITESILVGIYSTILILILLNTSLIKNENILFFCLGFTKHFLGYYLGIHDYYCQIKTNQPGSNQIKSNQPRSNGQNLFAEGLAEGLVFAAGNNIMSPFIDNNYYKAFMMGAGAHVLAEFAGIHKYFLTKCAN